MMTTPRRRRLLAGAAAAAATALLTTACGGGSGDGDFPARNIEIVVPYPAGGPTDTVARALADALNKTGKLNGRRAVVSNLTGGSGASAAIYVNNAKPDGTTVGVFPMSAFTIATLLKDQPYSADQVDLLLNVGEGGNLVLVPGDAPYDDFEEFCEAAAEEPGTFTIGNPGSANLSETQLRVLATATDCDYKVVNFEGAAPALTAMLGGNIHAYLAGSAGISGQVESGDVKGILQLSGESGPGFLEDIPTALDLLGPEVWEKLEVSALSNNMVAVSAKVPDDVKDELLAAVEEAAESDGFQEAMAAMGLVVPLDGSEENRARVESELAWYQETVPDVCADTADSDAPLCVAWAARPGA